VQGTLGGAPLLNFPDAQYTQGDVSSMQVTAVQQEVQHSNYTGVSVVRHTGKWKAYINHSGGKHHLGCFECEVDAAKAYDDGIRQLQLKAGHTMGCHQPCHPLPSVLFQFYVPSWGITYCTAHSWMSHTSVCAHAAQAQPVERCLTVELLDCMVFFL
jgi:hypothetical protein